MAAIQPWQRRVWWKPVFRDPSDPDLEIVNDLQLGGFCCEEDGRGLSRLNAKALCGSNRWGHSMLNSIIGLVILIADIWAIINVAQSSASTGAKALWIVLVLVLPVLGFIIWYFAGPKSASG